PACPFRQKLLARWVENVVERLDRFLPRLGRRLVKFLAHIAQYWSVAIKQVNRFPRMFLPAKHLWHFLPPVGRHGEFLARSSLNFQQDKMELGCSLAC